MKFLPYSVFDFRSSSDGCASWFNFAYDDESFSVHSYVDSVIPHVQRRALERLWIFGEEDVVEHGIASNIEYTLSNYLYPSKKRTKNLSWRPI